MNKLTLLISLAISVVLSTSSDADWTKVTQALNGDDHYVDFERIRKHSGQVYYWVMRDYLKPDEFGYLSDKYYYQGDCKQNRYNGLNAILYKEPMIEGDGESTRLKSKKWVYSNSKTLSATILKAVCKYMKQKGASRLERPSMMKKFGLKPMPPTPSSEKKLSPSESREELLNIMKKYSPSKNIK